MRVRRADRKKVSFIGDFLAAHRSIVSCRLTDTAASFIGLAYIVFFRFIGLALLLWMAGKAELGADASCITKGEAV